MTDLRKLYGEDYYKNIRAKRVTPSKGYFRTVDEEARKELGRQGGVTRWKKEKPTDDV